MLPLPKLTKTQLVILFLFYRFRFLTRSQIQKLLNHKSHTLILEWINDLYERGYILKRNKLDPTDVREPEVLYLSSKSIQALSLNKDCDKRILRKFYREDVSSTRFFRQLN